MKFIETTIPTSPTLGATLTLPDEPAVAALIVQGSGVHDRDGNMPAVGFKSTLYRRVARELARRGKLASLRFDKRGSDKSADEPQDYTIPQRLDDLRAALTVLRENEHTANLPLFLIGHSEGAMMVAKLGETENVRGIVSLAAPFGNVFQLQRERARRLTSEGRGAVKARGERALEFYQRIEQLFKEGAKLLPEQFKEFADEYRDAGFQGWESYEWLAGHWANALQSDPTKSSKPMLVVQGGRDARLWPDNDERWQAWCETRELADFVLIDHMGHDLNDARQKAFRVDDDVLDTVVEWTRKH
ncbi:MAG: alpha/beta fold hydrolase [Planctomycetes bacterium]|nr:alpha/beta fold hydrolase [Planctomycetota bacterium]